MFLYHGHLTRFRINDDEHPLVTISMYFRSWAHFSSRMYNTSMANLPTQHTFPWLHILFFSSLPNWARLHCIAQHSLASFFFPLYVHFEYPFVQFRAGAAKLGRGGGFADLHRRESPDRKGPQPALVVTLLR
jgi:hypothetical protein